MPPPSASAPSLPEPASAAGQRGQAGLGATLTDALRPWSTGSAWLAEPAPGHLLQLPGPVPSPAFC